MAVDPADAARPAAARGGRSRGADRRVPSLSWPRSLHREAPSDPGALPTTMTDESPAPPLPGATLDEQSVTSDWTVLRNLADGVRLHEVRNVIRDSGHV